VAQTSDAQAICTEVVKLLQAAREGREWSKYEIARRSGVSQSMLGRVERGLRNPTLETVLKLAIALEVDLGDIIKTAERAHRAKAG
jgi:transcriptional regulator with XRE-family HTH domain